MGVPGFFRFIENQHGEACRRIYKDSPPLGFNSLYLDMNGIVHECIDYTTLISEQKIFTAVAKHMDMVVDLVNPETIYIAVDGVSPHAKFFEQRVRRFSPRTESFFGAFDGNSVAPGTEFMSKLSTFLKYHIKERIQQSPLWKTAKVILSDSNVPGEGEHKIVEYIREIRRKELWCPDVRHCMYGNDSDLILLALASHEQHISVLRHKAQQGGDDHGTPFRFDLVDVGRLRQSLARELLGSSSNSGRDASRLCDDFVLLCHLAGNDFLPPLPGYSVVDGMGTLLREYKALVGRWRGFITSDEGAQVDLIRLQQLLASLGKIQRGVKPPTPATEQHRRSYIEGILWCQHYYMRSCSSWSWQYPYLFAPFAAELQEITGVEVPSEPQAEPMSHFEYLLALLPQASRDLLPAPYGELMRGPRGPLAEMSAAPFASGTEYAAVPGASLIGGGSAMRPRVHTELVVAEYSKVPATDLNERERDRNRFGRVMAFAFSSRPEHRHTVPSPLRNLKALNVCVRCAYDIFPGTPRPPPCTPPLPTTQARAGTCRNPPRSRMFYDGLDCVPGYERYRNSGSRGFKQVDKYEQDRSSFIVHIR